MRSGYRTPVIGLVVILALGLIVFGWRGVTSEVRMIRAAASQNPPFRNELKMDIIQPISKFDPVQANPVVYDQVIVYDAAGRKTTLDASKTPLLFEAYWCPHCQRTLVLLNHNWSKLSQKPLIVSMGFKPNTSLKEAVHLEQQELQTYHMKSFQIYYLLDPNQSKYVPYTYPTLVFNRNGSLDMLHGEHTLSAWMKALNASKASH